MVASHSSKERILFHGTTYVGVEGILKNGFQESENPAVHELTVPGVNLADVLESSLFYHGTPTKFAPELRSPYGQPYARFVLVVGCSGDPKKKPWSYGQGCQWVLLISNIVTSKSWWRLLIEILLRFLSLLY